MENKATTLNSHRDKQLNTHIAIMFVVNEAGFSCLGRCFGFFKY